MPTLFSVYNKEGSNESVSEKCMAKVPVISLSGNPFGVAVTVELLIRPALEKTMQNPAIGLKEVAGVMADDFVKGIKGRRFIRQDIAMAIFTAVTQGILIAGLSTYVNQIVKQTNKDE